MKKSKQLYVQSVDKSLPLKYEYKGRILDKKKVGWKCVGFRQVEGNWVGIMRRRSYMFEFIIVLLIVVMYLFYSNVPEVAFYVTQPETIYYNNGTLQLNIINREFNGYDVDYCLYSDKLLSEWGTLSVGGSIGNKNMELSLPKGSHMISIRYRLHTKPFTRYVDVPILLVVGEVPTEQGYTNYNALEV